jgi:hypothetical protein
LIQYFQANQTDIPELALSKSGAGLGSVKTNLQNGAILVANESNKVYRLSWEDPKSAKRYLPAGMYKVRGYRIVKKAEDGRVWHVSAMAPEIKSFRVEAGKESRVELSSDISLNSGLMANKGTVQVSMQITGENHSGLSIYAAGKRIPIGYEVMDSRGNVQASGSMTYG